MIQNRPQTVFENFVVGLRFFKDKTAVLKLSACRNPTLSDHFFLIGRMAFDLLESLLALLELCKSLNFGSRPLPEHVLSAFENRSVHLKVAILNYLYYSPYF
jgi:hypothetical protein